MLPANIPNIKQPQSKTLDIMDIARRDSKKLFEDFFLVLFGYAYSLIGDTDFDFIAYFFGRKADIRHFFAIFDRIVQ